jgi:hypothetical protein
MSIRTVLALCVLAASRAFTANLRRCERLPNQIGNRTGSRCKIGSTLNRQQSIVPSRGIITQPHMLHGSLPTVALVMKQNEEHEVTDDLDQQGIDLLPQVTKLLSFLDAIIVQFMW